MRKMTIEYIEYCENICNDFNIVQFDNNARFDIYAMRDDRVTFKFNDCEHVFTIEFIEHINSMIDDIECMCENIDIKKITLITYDAIAQIDSRYVFHVNDTHIIIFNDENVDVFTTIEQHKNE